MANSSFIIPHSSFQEVYRCMKCGNCREVCPVFLETGHEAMVARGRVQLLKAALENRLDLTDGLRDRVYACLNCNACYVTCPCGIEVDQLILASRIAMMRAGKPLPDGLRLLRDRIGAEQNPYGEKQSERGDWLPEKYRKPRGSPVVFHAGCAISYANNRVGKMVLAILESAGAEFMMMGDEEQCCGDPILRMGDVEGAEAQRRRNVAEYRKWGVETIVTSCAGCLKMFKHHYSVAGDQLSVAGKQEPATGHQPPATNHEPPATAAFRVLHTLEWFAQLIGDGRLKPQKPLAKRVAYFDGCDIGRHSGVYEAPRQVLRSIPGVELVEFPAHHESSRCCGGPLMASDPAMAAAIASKRVREALDVGAEMLAVACPTCMVNLKDGANRLGAKIEIQDVTALLHRSVK